MLTDQEIKEFEDRFPLEGRAAYQLREDIKSFLSLKKSAWLKEGREEMLTKAKELLNKGYEPRTIIDGLESVIFNSKLNEEKNIPSL